MGLLLSGGVHAAVLSWGSIEVSPLPDSPQIAARVVSPDAPPPAERVIQVVRIRPPGVLPAQSGTERGGSAPVAAPPAARVQPLTAAPRPVALEGAVTSHGEPAVIAAALAADEHEDDGPSAIVSRRPNRGVVLREDAGDGGSGVRGRASEGLGFGSGGGSGVTIVGRGGDCITPGLAVPTSRLPAGGWLPNRRVGGGPGSGRIGRIGRP